MFSYLLLVAFAAFVFYVLSAGPVAGYYLNHLGAPTAPFVELFYAPVTYVCDKSDAAESLMEVYVGLWYLVFE